MTLRTKDAAYRVLLALVGVLRLIWGFCPCPSPPVSQSSPFRCPLHPKLGIAGKSNQCILWPLFKPLINYCMEQHWV